MTPAAAVGLTDKQMDMGDIVRLIDDAEMKVAIQARAASLAASKLN
jgi:hypothetical protein